MDVDTHIVCADPLRAVDWRFRAARDLVDRGRYVSRTYHDEPIAQCVEYLRRRDNCRTSADYRRLADRYPDLHCAVQIYSDARGSTKYHLEARLLSGSPVTSIAAKLSLTSGTVRWYHCLAFDVSDRLENNGLLADLVLGRGVGDSAADWRDTTWKFAGYFGGPAMLDEILCADRGRGMDGVSRGQRLEQQILLAQTFARSVRMMDRADAQSLRELLRHEWERSRADDKADSESERLTANLQAMLENFPFRAVGRADLPMLAEHDKWAAELRTDELLSLFIGVPLANEARIRSMRFPAPKSVD